MCLGFRQSASAAGCLSGSQPAADLNSILRASRQLTAPQCPISTRDSTDGRVHLLPFYTLMQREALPAYISFTRLNFKG